MHRLHKRMTTLERHAGGRQRQLSPGVYFLGDVSWRTAPLDSPVLVFGGRKEAYIAACRLLCGMSEADDCPCWQTLREILEARE